MAKKKINKQILRYGEWKHPNAPGGVLKVTKEMASQLVDNFKRTPFAPVLRGHVSNEEAEKNPYLIVNKNIQGLNFDDEGINAEMEIDEKDLDKYNDVSAGLDMDYVDKETGKGIGAVLRHVALVLNPYIKQLKPFLSEDENISLIYLSDINPMEKEKKPVEASEDTQDEAVVEDVEADTTAKVVEEATEETTEETEAPVEEETEDEEVDASDVSATTVDLHETVSKQQQEIDKLKAQLLERSVEQGYDTLLSEGKIMPSQERAVKGLLRLSESTVNLSDGEDATVGSLLTELFDKAPSLVNLKEAGVLIEDGKSEIDTDEKRKLRKLYPNLSDEQFEDYVKENEVLIKKAITKHKN